jgi:predicted Rossmann-fold nucleotide-binding protein
MTFVDPSHIPRFLLSAGIQKVIAFSGGASSIPAELGEAGNTLSQASTVLEATIIKDALLKLKLYAASIAILTGGTDWGIPALASRQAKALGFKTIGIFPKRGVDSALGEDMLDLRVCVDTDPEFCCDTPEQRSKFESAWGDESACFAKTLDGMIVMSGRAGTLVEVAHVLKINEGRVKKNRPTKMIVPIAYGGGTAETIGHLPADPEVRHRCMPAEVIRTGRAAALFLINKLDLEDVFNETTAA